MSIMDTMEHKKPREKPRARRSFTPEFKAEIVELCQRGGRSTGQVARDFDLTETAVREWVRQAERDAGRGGDGGLTSAERHELSALRRENQRLRQDVEVLKRATAVFVSEARRTSSRSSRRSRAPDPAAAARADLVRRDFTVNAAAVNTRWCGDTTYIPTGEGWLYL